MSYEMAFYKYACYLQDKLNKSASQAEWICGRCSSEQPDGSWALVGASSKKVVAKVWADGRCVLV